MTRDEFAAHLDGVRCGNGYSCRCPAHDDANRSLSVGPGTKHPIVFRCHRAAGCSQSAIIEALKARGLWPLTATLSAERIVPMKRTTTTSSKAKAAQVKRRIVVTYSYVDEDDRELFQVVRFEPKDFRQRHRGPDGQWAWNLKSVRRVLYRLPRIAMAVQLDRHVFVCEGEKDAANLSRAFNVVATTAPMGAEHWESSYSDALRGARVVILPDADKPGWEHAVMVREQLRGIARSVVVVLADTAAPKSDVSDWLAAGGTLRDLILSTEVTEAFI